MKNYRIVDSCMTCKFHLEESNYDAPFYYYCNFDETFVAEYFYGFLDKKMFEKAREWAKDHIIQENGICDNFCSRITNKIDVLS